jgi:hypothetical protein
MKAYTFTTRNVTAGQRNNAGEMVLHHLGNITLTLEAMTRTEVTDWADITDALNTRGIGQETFRLTVNGWKVIHPQAGIVGVLFQGAGTRVHVEWYDAANADYFFAGWVRNLRHGAAAIINARQHASQGLPVDVEPEPYKAPAVQGPVWLREGTAVRYHGTFAATFADLGISDFRVFWCGDGDCDCDRYELRTSGLHEPLALHVRPDSVTALDAEPALA